MITRSIPQLYQGGRGHKTDPLAQPLRDLLPAGQRQRVLFFILLSGLALVLGAYLQVFRDQVAVQPQALDGVLESGTVPRAGRGRTGSSRP